MSYEEDLAAPTKVLRSLFYVALWYGRLDKPFEPPQLLSLGSRVLVTQLPNSDWLVVSSAEAALLAGYGVDHPYPYEPDWPDHES
jgi:hypothetical protein